MRLVWSVILFLLLLLLLLLLVLEAGLGVWVHKIAALFGVHES